MKELNQRPNSGQWIVVWEYNGRIWAATEAWTENGIRRYSDEDGDFTMPAICHSKKCTNIRYFTNEQE